MQAQTQFCDPPMVCRVVLEFLEDVKRSRAVGWWSDESHDGSSRPDWPSWRFDPELPVSPEGWTAFPDWTFEALFQSLFEIAHSILTEYQIFSDAGLWISRFVLVDSIGKILLVGRSWLTVWLRKKSFRWMCWLFFRGVRSSFTDNSSYGGDLVASYKAHNKI